MFRHTRWSIREGAMEYHSTWWKEREGEERRKGLGETWCTMEEEDVREGEGGEGRRKTVGVQTHPRDVCAVDG